jgi:hypothetical protein
MPDQCDNCKFYRLRTYDTKTVGECRFGDPFAQGQKGYWPTVKPDDWCGKWEMIPVPLEKQDTSNVRMLGEVPP